MDTSNSSNIIKKAIKFYCKMNRSRSSIKPRYPPANYRTNGTIYNAKKRGFNISNKKISYKNVLNLISDKQEKNT